MKLHTIGEFELDGRTLRGVVLTGTNDEIQALARVMTRGDDEFDVVRRAVEPTTKEKL